MCSKNSHGHIFSRGVLQFIPHSTSVLTSDCKIHNFLSLESCIHTKYAIFFSLFSFSVGNVVLVLEFFLAELANSVALWNQCRSQRDRGETAPDPSGWHQVPGRGESPADVYIGAHLDLTLNSEDSAGPRHRNCSLRALEWPDQQPNP